MSVLIIDFETRSEADLRKAGAWVYAHHESTRALMCAYFDPKEHDSVQVAIGEEAIKNIPGLLDPTVKKVAHNASFERYIIKGRFGVLPDPETFIDTASYGALYGLPRSLKDMANALNVEAKDEAGTRLINLFAKPQKRGEKWRDISTNTDEYIDFVNYCKQDVWVTYLILKKLAKLPYMQTPEEKDLYHLSERINDKGVPVDVSFTRIAAQLVEDNIAANKKKFEDMTGVDNANSRKQVMEWLDSQGVELGDSLDKTAIEAYLVDDSVPAHAKEALKVKQSLTAGSLTRFQTFTDYGSVDGAIHGCFQYAGAHTGRYSSRGLQFQNMFNGSFDNDEQTLEAMGKVRQGQWLGGEDMKKLIRASIDGGEYGWIVSDFSAIEARVVAWLAGEQWVLDTFQAGKDIYVQTASMMFGVSYDDAWEYRKQGKVAVLACGYSGGQGAIEAFSGDTFTREERQSMVDKYRQANPKIQKFWHTLEKAFWHGGQAGEFITIEVHGTTRKVILPSGRALFYHNVRKEPRIHTFRDVEGNTYKKKVMTLLFSKGGKTDTTTGGRLAENCTQAVARDLLGSAMLRLDKHGHDIRMHVHDEVLVLAKKDTTEEEITRLMSVTPDYAPGLPIEAGTYRCRVYRKE